MTKTKNKRYLEIFDFHYRCSECHREIKTSACKKPIHCPFCNNTKLYLLENNVIKGG